MKKLISVIFLAMFPVLCFAQNNVNPKDAAYPTKPGIYKSGNWEYSYQIELKGTKSEQRIGVLKFNGVLIEGSFGDVKDTPFGKLMYFTPRGYNAGWLNTLTYGHRVFDEKGELTKIVKDMLSDPF